MKYLRQFGLVLLFSLLGELCRFLIPFPIPASIYGMILLFIALACKLVKVEAVKETGSFLVSMLPLLFVVTTVGLMGCWSLIRDKLPQLAILVVVTTVVTFGVSGILTKVLRKDGDEDA